MEQRVGLNVTGVIREDLFQKNQILTQMKRPQVLYLCRKEGEGELYTNVYYETGQNGHNTVSLINDKVLHPILKTVYLFSTTPLPSEYPPDRIKRYALFIDPKNKVEGELIPQEPVVGIEENGVEFWGTKSPKYFTEI